MGGEVLVIRCGRSVIGYDLHVRCLGVLGVHEQ